MRITDAELDYWGDRFQALGLELYMTFGAFIEAPRRHLDRILGGDYRPLLPAQEKVRRELAELGRYDMIERMEAADELIRRSVHQRLSYGAELEVVMHSTEKERQALLAVMQYHVGRKKGVGVTPLAARLRTTERRCRYIISDLREIGFAVCGSPATGYYMAANADDLNDCCEFLRRRALHSLRLEARLRKMALPDLIEQLRFTEA